MIAGNHRVLRYFGFVYLFLGAVLLVAYLNPEMELLNQFMIALAIGSFVGIGCTLYVTGLAQKRNEENERE